MRLLHISRTAAANAMVVLVLLITLLGSACEARFVVPAGAARACCPMLDVSRHSSASIARAAVCRHTASVPSAYLVAPVGLIAGPASFTPLEPLRVESESEMRHAPVTASPPKFHLRI